MEWYTKWVSQRSTPMDTLGLDRLRPHTRIWRKLMTSTALSWHIGSRELILKGHPSWYCLRRTVLNIGNRTLADVGLGAKSPADVPSKIWLYKLPKQILLLGNVCIRHRTVVRHCYYTYLFSVCGLSFKSGLFVVIYYIFSFEKFNFSIKTWNEVAKLFAKNSDD
jgi:hypothetical protein